MKEEYLSIDTITRLVELEKENKELKDRYEKSKKQKIKVEDACSNYKYRIDKAIEYIHNHQLVFELSSKKQIQYWFDMFYRELLDILKGEDGDE